MNKGTIYRILILVLGVVYILVHHVYFNYGYFGYDDLHYSKLAHKLSQGIIDYSDHYSYRWTILVATALSYKIFGVHDFASALPSLVISVLMLYLVYREFRKKPPYMTLLAFLLLFSIKWFVFYTDKLMPDVYVSFFIFCAWKAYKNHTYSAAVRSSIFAVSMLFAFLSKGTVILMAPVLILYIVLDTIQKKNTSFWKQSFGIGATLIALYLGYFAVSEGSPWARFSAITANEYFNDCSYALMPWEKTIERLTSGFFKLITEEGLLTYVLVAIAAVLIYTMKRHSPSQTIRFYIYTIIALFLSMNFMTISLTTYNPACLDIRHFLFCIPLCAICCTHIIGRFLGENTILHIGSIAIASYLCVSTYEFMQYEKSLKYPETKKDLIALLANPEYNKKHIVCNDVMYNLLDYYSRYRLSPNVRAYKDLSPSADSIGRETLIIDNWYTQFHSSTDIKKICTRLAVDPSLLKRDSLLSSPFHSLNVYQHIADSN